MTIMHTHSGLPFFSFIVRWNKNNNGDKKTPFVVHMKKLAYLAILNALREDTD